MIPHVSIGGYAYVGKTTTSHLLASRHNTVWVPRLTSGPKKPGVTVDTEYCHITEAKFLWAAKRNRFIEKTVTLRTKGRTRYYTGIPNPEYWQPKEDTTLLLSIFGTSGPIIKELLSIENMVTIFLTCKPEELERRIIARKTRNRESRSIVEQRRTTNDLYRKHEKVQSMFDYVIENDGTPLECVEKIEKIVGLI